MKRLLQLFSLVFLVAGLIDRAEAQDAPPPPPPAPDQGPTYAPPPPPVAPPQCGVFPAPPTQIDPTETTGIGIPSDRTRRRRRLAA